MGYTTTGSSKVTQDVKGHHILLYLTREGTSALKSLAHYIERWNLPICLSAEALHADGMHISSWLAL